MSFMNAISFTQSNDKQILSNDSFGTFIEGHIRFYRQYLVTMSLILFGGKQTSTIKLN